MGRITIHIPDEVLCDTEMTEEEATDFVSKTVAMRLYDQNKVSLGYCAQIAGMTEAEFLAYLGQNHISPFQFGDEAEFTDELSQA